MVFGAAEGKTGVTARWSRLTPSELPPGAGSNGRFLLEPLQHNPSFEDEFPVVGVVRVVSLPRVIDVRRRARGGRRWENLTCGRSTTAPVRTAAARAQARANALWGKGRKRYVVLLALAVIAISGLAATTSASAAEISNLTRVLPEAPPPPVPKPPKAQPRKKPFVPTELKSAALDAKRDPVKTLSVIIQADDPDNLAVVDTAVSKAQQKHPGRGKGVEQEFSSVGAALFGLAAGGVSLLCDHEPALVRDQGGGRPLRSRRLAGKLRVARAPPTSRTALWEPRSRCRPWTSRT